MGTSVGFIPLAVVALTVVVASRFMVKVGTSSISKNERSRTGTIVDLVLMSIQVLIIGFGFIA